MTPEAVVSAVILAVILLINVLGRLLGPPQEEQGETGDMPPSLERQRPPRQRPDSRLLRPPRRKPPQPTRIVPSAVPDRRVADSRRSAARRLGVTDPRALRRAIVLMTLLGPCRAVDPDGGTLARY